MDTVTIVPDLSDQASPGFRASTGSYHSIGRTPGAALDALSQLMPDSDEATVLVVRQFGPDPYFGEAQVARLETLQLQHQSAVDSGIVMSASDRAEYEALIAAEQRAVIERSAAIVRAARK